MLNPPWGLNTDTPVQSLCMPLLKTEHKLATLKVLQRPSQVLLHHRRGRIRAPGTCARLDTTALKGPCIPNRVQSVHFYLLLVLMTKIPASPARLGSLALIRARLRLGCVAYRGSIALLGPSLQPCFVPLGTLALQLRQPQCHVQRGDTCQTSVIAAAALCALLGQHAHLGLPPRARALLAGRAHPVHPLPLLNCVQQGVFLVLQI